VNNLYIQTILLAGALLGVTGQAKTGLQGTIGHQTNFFTEDLRTRHHRYYLDLKQNTDLIPYKLATIIDGRFISDQAVSSHKLAPNWNFSDDVREDEFFESHLRQAYVDYLTNSTQAKIGIQQIDWIESLAQNVSNILTPLDLRFGGFGASNDLIRPVGAVLFNHKLFEGNVDWLVVTHPESNRLAVGDNAYGYYPTLSAMVGGAAFDVVQEERARSEKNLETGLRFSLNFDSLSLTAIAYRGQNRNPILRANAVTATSFRITETHPDVNTYVVSGSTSDDALVVRGLMLHQPNRPVSYSIGTAATGGIAPNATQTHSRLVGGLDYAYSKHFKFYSELIASRSQTKEDDFYTLQGRRQPNTNEFAASIRTTNESFDDTTLSLDLTVTGPDRSSAVTGQAEWTFAESYRLNLGGRRISATHSDASFYTLRKTSQYFVSIEKSFNENSFK
jgi:hypothetical protein